MWKKLAELKAAVKARATARTAEQTTAAELKLKEAQAERQLLEKKAALENQLRMENRANFALRNPTIARALENAKARQAASKQPTGFVQGTPNPFAGSNADLLKRAQSPITSPALNQRVSSVPRNNLFGGSLADVANPLPSVKAIKKKK